MGDTVTIKRRVKDKKTKKYKEIEEKATLIQENKYSYHVQLKNGDIIKRKKKDVSNEQPTVRT